MVPVVAPLYQRSFVTAAQVQHVDQTAESSKGDPSYWTAMRAGIPRRGDVPASEKVGVKKV
jgi:hypothetical protein